MGAFPCLNLRWKIIFLSLILVAGLIGVEIIRWRSRATEIFRNEGCEVQAGIKELRSRDGRRPPLLDQSIDGNGWEFYAWTLQHVVEAFSSDGHPEFPGGPPLDLERYLLAHIPLVNALRQALRCNRVVVDGYEDNAMGQLLASHVLLGRIGILGMTLTSVARGLHQAGRDREAFEILLIVLGMTSDLRRDGNGSDASGTLEVERRALKVLKEILSSHSVGAYELSNGIEVIKRLRSGRPSIHENVYVEGLGQRETILISERAGRNFFVWESHASWKYMFSRSFKRAAGLQALKEIFRELEQLKALPPWQWTRNLANATHDRRFKEFFVNLEDIEPLYAKEVGAQTEISLLHVATAIAWFQEERGANPISLDEIVPRYLESVPLCPATGQPLEYEHGRVWSPGSPKEAWTVKCR